MYLVFLHSQHCLFVADIVMIIFSSCETNTVVVLMVFTALLLAFLQHHSDCNSYHGADGEGKAINIPTQWVTLLRESPLDVELYCEQCTYTFTHLGVIN